MNDGVRRGVTRAYVVGLLAATLIVAVALLLVSWGFLGLAVGHGPIVSENVPYWFGTFTVLGGLAMLAALLWRHALILLRGRKAPAWSIVVGAAFGVYLIWCLVGILGGLSIGELWLSPFAAILAFIWAISVILFWLVLARRVYTDRPAPRWPWEHREERERIEEELEELQQRERDEREGRADPDDPDGRDEP